MEEIRITVADIPPSNNQYLGNSHSHWGYAKTKKKWDGLIGAALAGKAPSSPIQKAFVEIHYFFPDRRRRDPDNYSGKMILDALVSHGVIEDDSFWNITLAVTAECSPGVRATEVTVTEVDSL